MYPYAGILLFFLSFILISISFFKKLPAPSYIYSALALGVVYLQSNESRNQFLRSIFFRKKFLMVRLIENILCALPFSIFLVVRAEWIMALVLLFSSLLLSRYNKSGFTLTFYIPSPFSKRPYEFTTGFRSMYWLLAIIYCIAGISVYYHNLNLGFVTLLSLYFLCMSFYAHLDPIFYVWIHAKSPENFLKEKIKTAIFYSLFLSLPVFLLLILFNPGQFYQALIVLGVGSGYIMLSVLAVYVNFPARMTISHYFIFYFGILFPPALLFAIPFFYIQATQRLKAYLPC
jgi:hypothetical protein